MNGFCSGHESTHVLLRGFKISGIHYGYSHFNPLIIKKFLEDTNAKICYDPCGGWGHRILGSMNIDKYIENAKTDTEVKEAKEFEYNYGHKVIVGCVISVCFGNEVTTVCYAVQDKFKDMLIECSINYEVIKWAIENNYEIYSCFY